MGMLSFLDPVMDFMLGWLLGLNYFWAILILSFLLSVLITVIYKYTTNQSLMKDLKGEIKELQKEMKALRNEPQKMMAVQKKAMETNMKYMMHSMRSMIFTFIPIILIFGWMSSHFEYMPITPGEDFTTTMNFESAEGTAKIIVQEGIEIKGDAEQEISHNSAKWVLNGKEGDYILEYEYGQETFTKDVKITSGKEYVAPAKIVKDSAVKSITVGNQPVKIINLYVNGWKLGWLGTYILFSIIFSLLIRKWMKVY